MNTQTTLDDALARMQRLHDGDHDPAPSDAWLAAAVLELTKPTTPDDQELAAYAEGSLDGERKAAVELALLADPELRSSFLLFADALAHLDEEAEAAVPTLDPVLEPTKPPMLSVVDGGKKTPRAGESPAPRKAGPPQWLRFAIAAVLVLGLGSLLRSPETPPIEARLMIDSGPVVRGIPSLPPGASEVQVQARVLDDHWWAVVRARPGGALKGPEVLIAQAPQRGEDSERLEKNEVVFRGAVPEQRGELAYYVLVSDSKIKGLDRLVRDAQVRIVDHDSAPEGFAKALHSELQAHAEGEGWRISKVVQVSIKGL
jgi:hypothetical protein